MFCMLIAVFMLTVTLCGCNNAPISATSNIEPKVINIPADDIPKKYFSVKKDGLTLVENVSEDAVVETYTDTDGVQYFFDKETGKYSGFQISAGIPKSDEEIHSTKILEELADGVAEKFVSLKDYQRTYSRYEEINKRYYYNYHKYIHGEKTTDRVSITINADGKFVKAIAMDTGKFDTVKFDPIDHVKLEQQARQQIEAKGNTYKEVQDKTLNLKDGKLCMRYACKATTVSQNEEIEFLEEVYFEILQK